MAEQRQGNRLETVRNARNARKVATTVPPIVTGQCFLVYFGDALMGFSKVSGVECSVEFETLQEGGLNDQVHVLTKPGSQQGTLQLERGVVADGSYKDLLAALTPGRRISVPVSIILCHQTEDGLKQVRCFSFNDGLVTRRTMGEFDAMSGQIILEKLEISHAGLVEIEVT